jgi:hypothetical protein
MTDDKMSGLTKILTQISLKKEVNDLLVLSVITTFSNLGEHVNTKSIADDLFLLSLTPCRLAQKYSTKHPHLVSYTVV